MYIYALSKEDRDILIEKGYIKLFECKIDNKLAYCFENNKLNDIATFSNEYKKRYLITDVALIH